MTTAILYLLPASSIFFIDTFICSSKRRTRENCHGIGSNVTGARRMVHYAKE